MPEGFRLPIALDIHTAVQTTLIIVGLLVLIFIWRGILSIRSAQRLPFFRMRRDRMVRGWRYFIAAVLLIPIAFLLNSRVEPLIYRFYQPTSTATLTPTVTLTPTISLTPTITLSPTITLTPLVSNTPTITPTPFIPPDIGAQFENTITPSPDAVFSPLLFTDGLDALYRPIEEGTFFQQPIDHMYAVFSYDGMTRGAQWTALWYRNGELVHYESKPWDGDTGGLGYTDWQPAASEWQPGIYEVQIFVGLEWKVSGTFTVEGDAPTALPTETPTRTRIPTNTPTLTRTPRPTATVTPVPPTRTPYVSPTVTLTRTPWPTLTRTPVTPTITPQPTRTRTATPSP